MKMRMIFTLFFVLLCVPTMSFSQTRYGYFQILSEVGSGNIGGNIPLGMEEGSKRVRPYITHQAEMGAMLPSISGFFVKLGYRGRADFAPDTSTDGWHEASQLRSYTTTHAFEYIFTGIVVSNLNMTYESMIRAGISKQRLEHQHVIGWWRFPITPYGSINLYSEFLVDYRINTDLVNLWRNDPEFKDLGRDPTVEELPFTHNFLAQAVWLRLRHEMYMSLYGRINLFYIRNEIDVYSRSVYFADDPISIKLLSRFQVQVDNFTFYAVNTFRFHHLDKSNYWTPNVGDAEASLFSYAFEWSLLFGFQYKFEFFKP